MQSKFSLTILLLSILLGFFARLQQSPPPFPLRTNSGKDESVQIYTASIDPLHVFSDSYDEARTKFRQAATKLGCQLHQLSIPIPKEQSLLDDYTIDIAVIPGAGSGLVVQTSGVHGVEGYAGSAIQIAFLESLYPLYKGVQKESLPTIVLVHAVNPYGMAHYRRTNEANVDLNRNAQTEQEWKITNQQAGPTGIYEYYESIHSMLNPQDPPNWLYAMLTFWFHAGIHLAIHGFDALKAAVVTGQYYNPKGIFYGGNQLQPSLQKLNQFLQDQNRIHQTNGTVTWIDVHTGLGPSGVDSILFGSGKKTDKYYYYYTKEVQQWFPGAQVPELSESARDASKGYDKVKGTTMDYFQHVFDQDQPRPLPLILTQEFGTVPGVLVAHALIVENRAYQHLPVEQALEWARQTTKRAFYKQTPEWRKQILERGSQLLLQAIQRSSEHPEVGVRSEHRGGGVEKDSTTEE